MKRPLLGYPWLAAGKLVIDRAGRRALLAGRALPLTPRGLAVLEFLMLHPGEIIPRDRLLDAVWGWPRTTGPRAVDVRVAEVRRILGDDPAQPRYLQTVAGEGYAFVAEVWGQE